ncbi:MAG: helix-turn-helix transcriptional regulator [Oscillospiraceae bacterium]|nr:helix-turn-helix transcriptional regulator [Oscillospiraceae bacterium]
MDAAAVGTRIAALRKEKGLTQKQLAEQLHVTDKAVSKWERGLNFPDLALMEPLAQALGITVVELLGLEESTQEETVSAVSEMAQKEREKIKKRLRSSAWYGIVLGILGFAGWLYCDWVMFEAGITGWPRGLHIWSMMAAEVLVIYSILWLWNLTKL